MTSKGELDRFIGKTISVWCGEYDEDGAPSLLVINVEQVGSKWIFGTHLSDNNLKNRKVWIQIRNIVYFFEGDYFDEKKEHVEVVLTRKG